MTLADVPVPEPRTGQVRIRNRAAGLNFFDILQIQGKYQVKPAFPFTPGAEVAGVVDAAGPGVERFAVGDQVLAFTHNGGLAEYSIAESERTFHLFPGMDFPEGAALPVVYHTSHFGLHRRANLGFREWLLVHAGASGVGYSAIQIGKAQGARVIATAGSPRKLEFCQAQGADHVLNYRDSGWVERVKEITAGRGADVIYDPVGGEVFELSTRCIAPEGRLLVIGFASGRIPSVAANRVLLKNIAVVGVHWGQYVNDHPKYLGETHEVLAAMYLGEQIRPVVSAKYPLECAPGALRDLAERRIIGKAVLVME
ncbi:MAG TPA: NADPH:quinone oxidoreductase family protein [Bryobacteraceae bacterium]|nr:NADPH:quinone oxidoreductase family protein [Bryobacteraceae bacterium]